MHWTLTLISFVVGGLLSALVIQWKITGSVRVAGFLLIAAWVLQQYYFIHTGNEMPLPLFLSCDALIIAYLLRARTDWTDDAILSIYLPMIISYFLAEDETFHWWFLWVGTLCQMILVYPWLKFSKITGSQQHGPARELPNGVR